MAKINNRQVCGSSLRKVASRHQKEVTSKESWFLGSGL